MPTTHDSTVLVEMMFLFYAMLLEFNINIRKIIFDEIDRFSRKKKEKLFFRSLIKQLCLNVGVPHKPNEEVLLEKNNIDFQIFAPHFDSNRPSSRPPFPLIPTSKEILVPNNRS